jgi:hypothetical protein
VPSLDDLTVAISAAADQVRSLTAGAGASREQAEDLRNQLVDLGAERSAEQVGAAAAALEDGQAIAGTIVERLGAALAAVEKARSGNGGGAVAAGGGGAEPPGSPPATPVPPPEPEPDPGGSSNPSGAGPKAAVTRPRFAPDTKRGPRGEPANVADTGGNPTDIDRENDAATTLAKAGYDIEQNPPARPNGRRPDYMIDDEWWDCYAPRGTSTRTIHTAIRDKVGKSEADRQADRIILNLDGCSVSPEEIRARLERSPIRGLQEIKIVKGGKVTQFYPWDTEAEYDGD